MDGKAFGAEVVDIVKTFVERQIAPVFKRLDAIEVAIAALPAPKEASVDDVASVVREGIAPDLKSVHDGLRDLAKGIEAIDGLVAAKVDAAVAAIPPVEAKEVDAAVLRGMIADAVQALPPPTPGKDANPEDMRRMVDAAVAALPPAAPGKDADPAVIKQMVDEAVAALPPARDGKDVDQAAVEAKIADEVQRAVAAIPRPQDGTSVTLDDLAPVVAESVQKAVSALPGAKDGVSLAGAMVDRDGNLVLTLSDGTLCALGRVVGQDVDMAAVERSIAEKVAAIPVPKDGVDGVGFDDMTFEVRAEGCYLTFSKGEVVKEARLPIPTYREVYKEGTTYRAGDAVTWAGSLWIATEETSEKPDTGKGWRLAVKKGRDGKDKP